MRHNRKVMHIDVNDEEGRVRAEVEIGKLTPRDREILSNAQRLATELFAAHGEPRDSRPYTAEEIEAARAFASDAVPPSPAPGTRAE